MAIKNNKRSIAKRLMLGNIAAVGLVLVVVVVVLSVTTWSNIYSRIEQQMMNRSLEVVNMFAAPSEYNSGEEFNAVTTAYVQFFPDKDRMEMMNISAEGRILVTSGGFTPNRELKMPDYRAAMEDSEGIGLWKGYLESGEHVMALSRRILNTEGVNIGAVRYMVSLTRADRVLTVYISLYLSIAATVLAITTLACSIVTKSILVPIAKVNAAAKQIAGGDFGARIHKERNDEVGQLIDTINDMAAELGKSETLKNDFISSVSHELRTPLTSIEGWTETLQNSDMDPETRQKGMSIIMKETQRLTGLVEELLDFSRLQNGRLVMHMERVDLLTELDEVVFLVSDRIESEGKTLIYETPASLPPVKADPNRLRQVFFNVLDNAIKYSSKGSSISVSAVSSGSTVRVIIEDTGVGIAAIDLESVKKKFFKANQQVRGSGIGLAIVDEIISLHGGEVDITSKLGAGTKVSIILPVTPV